MREIAMRWMCLFAALIVALASAGPALAQGFYYKEIDKDDRIDVFNIAAEADRFEKSGEMGRGVTRPGAGPRARPSSATASARCSSSFSSTGSPKWSPSRLRRSSPSSGATARRASRRISPTSISNRVQVRYRTSFRMTPSPSARTVVPGFARSFRIRRAKFKLEGWFWRPPDVAPAPILPNLTYELQLNWPAVATRRHPRTSARFSKTPTSPGIRRARASSASWPASSRPRSAGSR